MSAYQGLLLGDGGPTGRSYVYKLCIEYTNTLHSMSMT